MVKRNAHRSSKPCGKHCHQSEGAAQAQLRSLGRFARKEPMHTYFCAGCKAWHVGRMKVEER